MSKVICDSFEGPDNDSNLRFNNGYKAKFIETPDKELSKSRFYSVSSKLCLAFTKSTTQNIFYVAPTIDTKFLSTWIDEISPHFPTLKIKLIKLLKDEYQIDTSVNSLDTQIPFLELEENLYRKVFLRLAISKDSKLHYSITNINHASHGKFTRLGFLINMVIRYYLSKKVVISCKEDIGNFISNFCLEQLDNVIKAFSSISNSVEVSLDTNNPVYSESHIVECGNIVDIRSINYKNIYEYLTTILTSNCDLFIKYLSEQDCDFTYDTILVQALFSKKAYPLESYLANHLIRAGLAPDQKSFVEQYFMVKEVLPEEHFWSRIVITQFGFRFQGYYWLTHLRTFRPFTEKEFLERARELGENSSNDLFKQFAVSLNSKKLNMLVRAYSTGKFKEFLAGGEAPVYVSLKESKKDKFVNLRICDRYEIFNEDEFNYYIKGDNFNIKRYLKTNFIKV